MNRILVIEDEEVILKALTRLLERNHYEVTPAMTVEAAIDAGPQSFDLILADLRLPGAEGTDVIPIADPIPVVIMTSHASVRSAVNAMRSGAIDYIAKPFDHDELLLVIQRALTQNRLRAQNQALRLDLTRLVPAENLKQCVGMQDLLTALEALPESSRFVSLAGLCGTGKELCARVLHASSERSDAPFVVADLPSFQRDDMSTVLMGGGHSDGSDSIMPGGLLHSAHNGTLIIRHPHVMPQDLQQTLASALSVGGIPGNAGLRSVNVRTIILTDTNVAEQQQAGLLDESFTSLFTDCEFQVPPLHQLRDDISTLATHFLGYFQHHHNRQNLRFSDEAMAALKAYSWPGNTDELKTVIERAVLVCANTRIRADDLGIGAGSDTGHSTSRDLSLDEYFRYFVLRHQSALSETELASRLGISRKALWERRHKIGLPRDAQSNP